ncbi:negative elongation factor E-like [Artemia franciscana]|uniref:Negative elongation factor E n=1 Tax=Artemia franciscana TaxID=6661 RepID=A0AA88HMV5_ARTSF|nr:hypothetical protein QYM36_011939 [Artemia franciscana]
MVYMKFPDTLTEEETMLMQKYKKLRKKKKALQAMKIPKQQEPEKPQLKRKAEALDAKEVAKKLIKSGAIAAITKPLERQEKTGFKRSVGLERKLAASERSMSSFQPFSSAQAGLIPTVKEEHPSESTTKPKVPNIYESFVPATGLVEKTVRRQSLKEEEEPKEASPKTGNTIYVHGYNITEQFLKKNFQKFGLIVNIAMEIEKNCGFITFESASSAEQAISQVNHTTISGIELRVSLARRQAAVTPINDASASSTWSSLAARNSLKGSQSQGEKRHLVAYDEELF